MNFVSRYSLNSIGERKARRFVWRISSVAIVLILLVAAAVLYSQKIVDIRPVIAMAIGGVVGAVEILGRYRHSPIRALTTWNGLSYVFINAGAAWVAYLMLRVFEVFGATPKDDLKLIFTAGFGSLVVMRSSLFRVRVGDSDIGIGPAAVLDTLLLVADRGVDRREAVARAQDVTELVSHVRDPAIVAKMLTKYSLALMQNVDEKTSKDVVDAIAKIMADTEVPDTIKMDIVALRLGVIVGPDVLEAAVTALGDRLTATQATQTTLQAKASTGPPPSVGDLRAEIDRANRPSS